MGEPSKPNYRRDIHLTKKKLSPLLPSAPGSVGAASVGRGGGLSDSKILLGVSKLELNEKAMTAGLIVP